MQATKFEVRLKDGAVATFRVTVELQQTAKNQDLREQDLANLVGGAIAGAISNVIDGQIIQAWPTSAKGV